MKLLDETTVQATVPPDSLPPPPVLHESKVFRRLVPSTCSLQETLQTLDHDDQDHNVIVAGTPAMLYESLLPLHSSSCCWRGIQPAWLLATRPLHIPELGCPPLWLLHLLSVTLSKFL